MSSFIDLTATLRLPRAPDEEDARALAAAAKAGGFHTVVVSARGQEAVDVDSLSALLRELEGHGVRLIPALAPVVGTELADVVSMVKSLPAGTPRVLRLRAAIDDALLLRRIGDLARGLDALVIVPSHDAALMKGALAVEGAVATRLGLSGVPEASEHIAISRILEVSKLTGARFHIAGVFTERGAALIESAGDPHVSGSVFASHLCFDDSALLTFRYETRVLTRPPLPTSSSRIALRAAVKRGALLASSGHHFIPKRERDLEMNRATPGMTSLASAARILGLPIAPTPFSPADLLRALSSGPAAALGIPAPDLSSDPSRSAAVVDDLFRLANDFGGGT